MKRTILSVVVLTIALTGFAQSEAADNKPDKPERESKGPLREAAERVVEKKGVEHDHHSFGDSDRGKTSVDRVTRDIGAGFEVGGFRSSTSDSHVGGDRSRGSQTYGGTIGFRW